MRNNDWDETVKKLLTDKNVITHPTVARAEMSPHRPPEMSEADFKKQQRELRKSFWLDKHWFLPKNFFDRDLIDFEKGFSPNEKKLIDAWDEGTDDFGFFILGKAGVGKTFVLQKLCLRVINSALNDNAAPEQLVRYFPVGILLTELRKFSTDILQQCLTKQFLFLDDLGAEYASDFAKEQLFTILDTRLINKLPTFLTSNLSLDEIGKRYGERISSRIKELCLIINLQGDDKRNEVYKDRIKTLSGRIKNAE